MVNIFSVPWYRILFPPPPFFPHLLQKGVVERGEVVVDDGIVDQLLFVLHQSALQGGGPGCVGLGVSLSHRIMHPTNSTLPNASL